MCILRTVARQRLGKHILAVTITEATTEELLDAFLLCGPCRVKGTLAISSSQNFLLLMVQLIDLILPAAL
jgi:hypothetical protein